MKILVDTNVVLRAAQASHPHHASAKSSLESALANGHQVCVVPQVLYEVWAVATRPSEQNGLGLPVQQAAELVSKIRDTFTLLEDPPGFADHWLQVVVENDSKGKTSHDARLYAAMLAHGVDHIITFNKSDFQRYKGLTTLFPPEMSKDGDTRKVVGDLEPSLTEERVTRSPIPERDKDRDR